MSLGTARHVPCRFPDGGRVSELVQIPIGYGFVLGPRCTGHEAVRKARKLHSCEGALIDSDAVADGDELSPGTGMVVFEGQGALCIRTIAAGDFYVAIELTGEDAQDFGASYRYTYRTCLACAMEFDTVRREPSDGIGITNEEK